MFWSGGQSPSPPKKKLKCTTASRQNEQNASKCTKLLNRTRDLRDQFLRFETETEQVQSQQVRPRPRLKRYSLNKRDWDWDSYSRIFETETKTETRKMCIFETETRKMVETDTETESFTDHTVASIYNLDQTWTFTAKTLA